MKQPGLITQAAYARHRKVSRSYVSRLAGRGILVMRGKLVDVAASDAVLDDKPVDFDVPEATAAGTKPVVDGAAGPPATSFAQARTADMVFRAKLRKLEHDVRVGKLVEADLVKQRWAVIYVAIKERILSWPNRIAPEVTPLTDERQVRDVMMREARALIGDLKTDVQYAR